MKCKDAILLLDDFYDGTLNKKKTAEIERHLKTCKECSIELEKIKSLVEELDSLPDSIEPPINLFPFIKEKINNKQIIKQQENKVYKIDWKFALAAVVIAVVLSSTMVYTLMKYSRRNNINVVMKEFEDAALNYIQTKDELMDLISSGDSTLDSNTVYEIERSVQLIDNAIKEIKFAIKKDPDNQMLVFKLADTYNKETSKLHRTKELILNFAEEENVK